MYILFCINLFILYNFFYILFLISLSLSVSHRYWHSQNTLHHQYSRCPGRPCRIPQHPRVTWKPRTQGTSPLRSILHPPILCLSHQGYQGRTPETFSETGCCCQLPELRKTIPKTPALVNFPMYHINKLTNPNTAPSPRSCFTQNQKQKSSDSSTAGLLHMKNDSQSSILVLPRHAQFKFHCWHAEHKRKYSLL